VWLLLALFLAQFSGGLLHGLHGVAVRREAARPAVYHTAATTGLTSTAAVAPEHDAAHCALCQGALRHGTVVPAANCIVAVLPKAVAFDAHALSVPLLAGAPAFAERGRAPPAC
jgi:hypothetical protein